MPSDRLSWSALIATAVVCVALDGAILVAILLLAGDIKTTVLLFIVGGGPVTLFAAGPLYSWFKIRATLAEHQLSKSAHLRARE
jgi:hypothetical protein